MATIRELKKNNKVKPFGLKVTGGNIFGEPFYNITFCGKKIESNIRGIENAMAEMTRLNKSYQRIK